MKDSSVSRRHIFQAAAGVALAAQSVAAQSPVTMTGRKFRAFVRFGTGAAVQELKLRPLHEEMVVVRTEATQACYTIVGQGLGTNNFTPARILGHGGVGVVEAIGAKVKRVQVGDRVIVANTPQCGQCYMCLDGRGELCQVKELPLLPIAEMQDGTPVVGHNNTGGFGELMVAYEAYCCPIFSAVPGAELAMLGCVGATGLGAVTSFVPVRPGSDVVVMGAGPMGLSAIQGARIMGAAQVIAVEPVRYRRELAAKVGATTVLDPNVEGDKLVERIRELCKGPTNRIFAGGREWTAVDSRGPDFTIECVGGSRFMPKVESGPDPTGLVPLRQAWEMTRAGGHLVTLAVGQPGNISFPAGTWSNRGRHHHAGQYGGVNSLRDLPRFVKLIEKGLYDAKSLSTGIFSLDQTRDALQAAADRTTVAAVLTFS
jgi:S-(hydroxymethyl)glutathione dehydrogenase / alcohol dehydrogenase